MIMKKISLSIVVLLVCYSFASAQNKAKTEPDKRWEIGINSGVANFTGDYIMYKDSRFKHPFGFDWRSHPNFGFGALVKKNFSEVFALEVAWNYSNLSGTAYDGKPFPPSPEFKTEVNEYDLNTVWNLNNLFSKNKLDRKLYLYAKVGLGYSHVWKKVGEAAVKNGENWKFPTIPLGTGVSYRLNDNVKINLGTQWSWINTDRLDGHNTPSTAKNTKSGNVKPDIFGTKLYTHAGISYSFGKKKNLLLNLQNHSQNQNQSLNQSLNQKNRK
jgi:opacity protein-like surface antigen